MNYLYLEGQRDIYVFFLQNIQAGMNEGDQTVKKINYTLDTLIDKYEDLHERLDKLMGEISVF